MLNSCVISLLYLIILLINHNSVRSQFITDIKCERIVVKQCNISNILRSVNTFLDKTKIPNRFNQNQKQVESELKQYKKLTGCSKQLYSFLCVAYMPICIDNTGLYLPCKSMCQHVKKECQQRINLFNLPRRGSIFDCDSYKQQSSNEICFREIISTTKVKRKKKIKRRYEFECPEELKVHSSKKYSVKVGDTAVKNCGIPCNDFTLFNSGQRKFSRYWILIWSGLCFASTIFTITTFSIDRSRFRYPERPIIMISACYCLISIVYLLGAIIGSNSSCAGFHYIQYYITSILHHFNVNHFNVNHFNVNHFNVNQIIHSHRLL